MSTNWVKDIEEMHTKYGVGAWTRLAYLQDKNKLREFLKFRILFLDEELHETKLAFENSDAEEVVDGLIDLCVVAIGTLEALGVNVEQAWDTVLAANLSKEIGIKESRPNPLGLPDLVKPEGWVAPDHSNNLGHTLPDILTAIPYIFVSADDT